MAPESDQMFEELGLSLSDAADLLERIADLAVIYTANEQGDVGRSALLCAKGLLREALPDVGEPTLCLIWGSAALTVRIVRQRLKAHLAATQELAGPPAKETVH